jgi:hypothetical protein
MSTASPSSFADFVDRHVPVDKELPFVHSTRCQVFHHLCSAGFLSPNECPVFKEPLLYFFYGRPAYRSRTGHLPNTAMAPMPICLVFKPGLFDGRLRRVFPFDTGAAHNGVFSPYVVPTDLMSFGFNPTLAAIKKAVRAFFETNSEYYAGTAKSGLKASPRTGLPAVDSYCSLITDEGVSSYDDRRAAIEGQMADLLPLKDNLLAIILPSPFLDDATVRDAIVYQWRAYPLCYNHVRGTAPNQSVGVIVEKLQAFLTKGGYF